MKKMNGQIIIEFMAALGMLLVAINRFSIKSTAGAIFAALACIAFAISGAIKLKKFNEPQEESNELQEESNEL